MADGRWYAALGLPLADMRLPAAVLPLLTSAVLLLTSSEAVRYRWLADVSLRGSAVQTSPADSRLICALRCEALPPESCSGFSYEDSDGSCRLFSGDCRGPAADSSQQTTGRYLSRDQCPGKNTQCPKT